MLWVKSLHIAVIASWVAGLFCLRGNFVNLEAAATGRKHSRVGYRWLNETPILLVLAIGAPAVVKPF